MSGATNWGSPDQTTDTIATDATAIDSTCIYSILK